MRSIHAGAEQGVAVNRYHVVTAALGVGAMVLAGLLADPGDQDTGHKITFGCEVSVPSCWKPVSGCWRESWDGELQCRVPALPGRLGGRISDGVLTNP